MSATQIPQPVKTTMGRLLLLSLIYIPILTAGYFWGYKTTQVNSGVRYKFIAVLANGTPVNGFYCNCYNSSSWTGVSSDQNCGPDINNKGGILRPYSFPSPPTTTTPGAYACCMGNPKIITKTKTGDRFPKTFNLLGSGVC
ncbi:MAG: hypothetical protein HOO93_19225 [Methyloglobulus sp.]|nr:hypothetical protein [Methyloglobulus sp.]